MSDSTTLTTDATGSASESCYRSIDPSVAPDSAGDPTSDASTTARIMIVDDEPSSAKIVERYLQDVGYRDLLNVTEPTKVIGEIRRSKPDLVLLDIMMPEVGGIEIMQALQRDPDLRDTPIIVLTAAVDPQTKLIALQLRVSDFLSKPVDPHELVPRVRNALIIKAHQDHLANYTRQIEERVAERTAELAASRQEVILCLARAAEYRDNEDGNHVIRVGKYVGAIARQLGFSKERVELLEQAAQLHDVGKIGVPDSILLKPGKLDEEEFELVKTHASVGRKIIQRLPGPELDVLKRHTEIGAKLLEVVQSPIIDLASIIALTHHERWDGSGYPLGLAGEDIPIEGRMTAVADVFDALSNKRPYKAAFPRKRCFQILGEARGKQFDPKVLDAFFRVADEVAEIQTEWSDD